MKTVVLFLGSSSVGKSTTCAALVASYGWRMHSIDEECEIAAKQRIAYYHRELESSGLYEKLTPYLSKEDVFNLCKNGILNIKKEDMKPYTCRFTNPEFPALDLRLEKAGFLKAEIDMLTPLLMSVAGIYKSWKDPILEDRLIEKAVNPLTPSDEFVIIDMVPLETPEKTQAMVEHFNRSAEEYKNQHGEDSIRVCVILAYCPPMKLSERLKQRNDEAEQKAQQFEVESEKERERLNKREWQKAFHQFSVLFNANTPASTNQHSLDTLSHRDLMKVSYMHNEEKPSGKPQLEPMVRALGRSAIDATKFSKLFGIKNSTDIIQLSISPILKYSGMIDTSVGSPDDLAKKVIAITAINTPAKKLKNN